MDNRFIRALQCITDDLSADAEVIAAIFFGSVQRGEGSLGSDLDFFVVTNGTEYWRSAKQVDGVVAELFCNPLGKMRKGLEDEDQIALNAFATGRLVLDRTGDGRELVELARRIWGSGPKPLSTEAAARWRYRITALVSDAQGLDPDSAEARLVAGMLVPLALEGYCALNRLWAEQPKHLIRHVGETDQELARIASTFYAQGMPTALAVAIGDRVLAPFGGRLEVYGTDRKQYAPPR